jgi:GntR family transcriptional regulator
MSLPDRSARINREEETLLSDQVARDVRAEIKAGRLRGRLPSEVEMAEQYGVARITIRRALRCLADEGAVAVLHGRGTFVKRGAGPSGSGRSSSKR